VHRTTDWDDIDMRQTKDGDYEKMAGSVGAHVGHAADEVWKTGAPSDYALDSSDVHTPV
jgi:hypothetical protein